MRLHVVVFNLSLVHLYRVPLIANNWHMKIQNSYIVYIL